MKIAAIIQARTGSTRLPNKVLKKIGKMTLLELLIRRIKKCTSINDVIVATTIKKNDDPIVDLLKHLNLNYFRGSENDVLDRFYKAALKYNVDVIIRITGDNPFTSVKIMSELIKKIINHNLDYVGVKNTVLGTGSEVFTFKSLRKVWNEAKYSYQREHVTPYYYENPSLFRIGYIDPPPFLRNKDLRLTIDTPEDWKLLEALYKNLGELDTLSLEDIIRFLDLHPEIKTLNSHVHQKKYYE